MPKSKVILEDKQFKLTIERICNQLIENYNDFSDTCIIGIQEKGVFFSDRIVKVLRKIHPESKFKYGKIDITFYRDDYRRRDTPLTASATEMDFIVDESNVILIDDVLYTGRSIQAGLIAIQHYGRPKKVELLTMVDRRFNRHLPIQPNYTGIIVDAVDEAYVRVHWEERDESDKILLFQGK